LEYTYINTNILGIPAPNPQSLAENICGTIASIETDFQSQLELLFENMGNTTFKACRRALPIDGRKIRWPQILSYKLGGMTIISLH
jgi:capping protein alpha